MGRDLSAAAATQPPAPFEIAALDGGGRAASNGAATVAVLDDDGRLFRRRAVKNVGTPEAYTVEWAVAELAGVRVYVDGANVVVTRRDLMP